MFPNTEEQFVAKLLSETGIGYEEATRVYGTYVGVQPDGALLLFEATQLDGVASVVELGSGFSTLWLALGAARRGLPFHAYEEEAQWLEPTRHLLQQYGLNPNCVELYTPPADVTADLAFFDPANKYELLARHQDALHHARCVIVDDVDFSGMLAWLGEFLLDGRRLSSWVYNPTGRYNRHMLISTADPMFNVAGWVESWRP